MYKKLCTTVQLSHYTSKTFPGDISQVIYIDPLEPTIEASLVEEGGVGDIIFQVIKMLI